MFVATKSHRKEWLTSDIQFVATKEEHSTVCISTPTTFRCRKEDSETKLAMKWSKIYYSFATLVADNSEFGTHPPHPPIALHAGVE